MSVECEVTGRQKKQAPKEESNKDFDRKGMATTVETLYLKGDTAYWGHVGDSRLYYLKNKGRENFLKSPLIML